MKDGLFANPKRSVPRILMHYCWPAVEGWNDMGLGKFELGYLRDKEKREVDFLVARDGEPWFLAEVNQSPAARLHLHPRKHPF
jgi:hypothetical protein